MYIMYIWGLFECLNKVNGYINVFAVFVFTISPNNIVATGEDSFYFTIYYKCDFIVELIRGVSVGNVVFYDGRRGHIPQAGISSPNGINTTPDGK